MAHGAASQAPAQAPAAPPPNPPAPPTELSPTELLAQRVRAEQEQQAEVMGLPVEITNALGMRFRLIPAGSFLMGDPAGDYEERPVHSVSLDAFYMGANEVTVGQFMQFVEATQYASLRWALEEGTTTPWNDQLSNPDHPVVDVAYPDADAFCQWLTTVVGSGSFSLPSEAQWEYACRAGTTTPWHSGTRTGPRWANFGDSRHPSLLDVGRLEPNAWGLHDMHGNAAEWCVDLYHAGYDGAPSDGSAWLSGASDPRLRVFRGGSYRDESRRGCSASRWQVLSDGHFDVSGFRVVWIPQELAERRHLVRADAAGGAPSDEPADTPASATVE